MNALFDKKNSASELHKKIQEHLEELAQATDKARTSAEMICYLDFCARFHNYSSSNIWLILLAKPNATHVAGFHKWTSMNRYVKKGEKGIPILAPLLHKEDVNDNSSRIILNGFRTVFVFDVSQTEGEPLPPQPDWKSPKKNAELQKRLIQFAESKGITVNIEQLDGEIQGISLGGRISLSPQAGTKTLIHEIAHELLHHSKVLYIDRAECELEAEAIGYSVAKYFGIEDLKSANYIALFGMTAEEIKSRMVRLQTTVAEIIIGIELDDNAS